VLVDGTVGGTTEGGDIRAIVAQLVAAYWFTISVAM
jgi:hypothetical protein